MPAFSSPIDCTPWVIGGLWPAELSTITAENAAVAEYLKTDLQRIADSANDHLKMIKRAGLADLPRQAEEARVIDEARARAVRRVESTIRQLHAVTAGATAGSARPHPAGPPPPPDMDRTQVLPAVADWGPPGRRPRWRVVEKPAPVAPDEGEPAAPPDDKAPEETAPTPDIEDTQVIPRISAAEPGTEAPAERAPEPAWEPAANGRHHLEPDELGWTPDAEMANAAVEETQIIPAIAEIEPEDPPIPRVATPAATPMEETQVIPAVTEPEPVDEEPAEVAAPADWEPVWNGRHHAEPDEPTGGEAELPDPVADIAAAAAMEETQVIPAVPEAEPAEAEPADSGRHHAEPEEPAGRGEPAPPEPFRRPAQEKATAATGFDIDRLNRLLEFVVRQEPRLNWAIGDRADGTTVLVTDLAHGWIPAGINLPAGVRLLAPERRTGRVAALIGDAIRVVSYSPGDSLRRSADFAATRSSSEPRELPAIADLGTVLSATTRRFEGLPRIVQRLADTAAAEAVVIDQEVDVLRVHLDTARYQLLVQYPTVNPTLLLKCLLMAATEGLASGDPVSANYHLAWYQKLAAEPPSA